MTAQANPLTNRAVKAGRVTREHLVEYAASLNRSPMSVAKGWHWFVSTREDIDGNRTAFLDRRDAVAR